MNKVIFRRLRPTEVLLRFLFLFLLICNGCTIFKQTQTIDSFSKFTSKKGKRILVYEQMPGMFNLSIKQKDSTIRQYSFYPDATILGISDFKCSNNKVGDGPQLIFKKGRLLYQITQKGNILHGDTWLFSKKGKLLAIYFYEHGQIIQVLYAVNKELENPSPDYRP